MAKKKVNYLSNKNILAIIKKWHDSGEEKIPDELANVAIMICDRLLTNSQWRGYSQDIKDEMKSHALFFFSKYFHSFDPEKSQNPFSYITTIAMNAFRQVINKEYEEKGKAANYFTTNTENVEHEEYYKHLVETQIDPLEKKREKRKEKAKNNKKKSVYKLFE